MSSNLYGLFGAWQQLAGGGTREFTIASAVMLASTLWIVYRQRRARAAQRLRAAARAYAEREIARERQMQTSGCPA
jgi:hypothetical protein